MIFGQEARELATYLRRDPTFDSVSSLGRAAILVFIRGQREREETKTPQPSFLWDYNLSEAQVRAMLQRGPVAQRSWLVARILERLNLSDVLKFLTVDEIRRELPGLRMDPKVKRYWQEAIRLWTVLASAS